MVIVKKLSTWVRTTVTTSSPFTIKWNVEMLRLGKNNKGATEKSHKKVSRFYVRLDDSADVLIYFNLLTDISF